MPFRKLTFKPGVNVEDTPTLNEGSWSASNLIRWRSGLPEKRGGWTQMSATPVKGVCRSIHAWADLSSNNYLALGTSSNLQLLFGSQVFDITPWAKTDTLTQPFTTTAGSPIIGVHDPGNNTNLGDYVIVDPLFAIGGIVLGGLYQVTNNIDGDNYQITANSNALSSSATGATPLFTTTLGSALVNVALVNHGFVTDDAFSVTFSTTVGGVVIEGVYPVTVVDANNFQIAASSIATSSASGFENGGNVDIHYLLSAGLTSVQDAMIWGTGVWGVGLWGGTSESSLPRIWSLDNFGQNLIAVPSGGALYVWTPPELPGSYNPAVIEPAAPPFNIGAFVAMPQEIVIAFGSSLNGSLTLDPLLIRWCDQADYTDWTPTAVNQAGSFRLSRGSTILGAVQAPSTALVWTDLDVWGIQYLGFPLVFGFSQLASNCGLISELAYAVMGNAIYWMSQRGFYMFNQGGVVPMPCAVWDIVFQNLNLTQASKVITASNSLFNEVMWFFPSATGNGEIDSYVCVNILDGSWDYGELVRTAWTDSNVFGPPIGVDGNGIIQQHETSFDANGVAMTGVSIMSAYTDIGDGETFPFADQFIPDFKWQGSNPSLNMTFYFTNWPGDTPTTQGPFVVTPTTEYITVRFRARQIAIKIEMDGADMWFRLGASRLRVQGAGRV